MRYDAGFLDETILCMTSGKASSNRRSNAVVCAIAAQALMTGLLGSVLTIRAAAFVWGYLAVTLFVVGIVLMALAAVLLRHRHRRGVSAGNRGK